MFGEKDTRDSWTTYIVCSLIELGENIGKAVIVMLLIIFWLKVLHAIFVPQAFILGG